jgi:hypothetical protein
VVGLIDCLDSCGYLCAATARWAEALTIWAACAAVLQAAGIAGIPQGTQRRERGQGNAR